MHLLSISTPAYWFLVGLGAFIIGLSKAGLKGIDMVNVALMAIVFGGKASTGIVLPLLCVADVLAVIYYNRHARWNHVWRLMPWMVIGIIIGVYVGQDMNEVIFRKIMALIIVLTAIIMVVLEIRKEMVIPKNRVFVATMGVAAGFTTMLGNLAGAFSNVYFLAMRMLKNNFIGTAAWIFLVMNFFKLPFQLFVWKNISLSTLQTDFISLPALLIGFWVGVKIVSRIKDSNYRKVVIALTLVGAVIIFLKQ